MAGLPLSKGRPLYLVTKHTKFNYSGKGELCFQHRKVIHMRWTPLLFCFPQCFHYDGSFLSFGGGRLRTCHCLIRCHLALCVFCVLFHEHTICLSSAFTSLLVLEAQTTFLQQLVLQAFPPFDVQLSQLTSLFSEWFTTVKAVTDSLKSALHEFSVDALLQWLQLAVRPVGCLCFMCILWRTLPKQDMPDSVDQPRALGHHCFFLFPSTHVHNSYSKRKKNAVDNTGRAIWYQSSCTFQPIIYITLEVTRS